jgi:hypothetical protein
MAQMFILFFISLLSLSYGSIEALESALTVVEILDKMKQTHSTEISALHNGEGFAQLNNKLEKTSGAIFIDNLDKLLNIWIEDARISTNQEIKNAIDKLQRHLSLQVSYEGFEDTQVRFGFNDDNGMMVLFMIKFSKHEKRNAIYYKKIAIITDFIPSRKSVVVTDMDCDIFSCDRTDSIIYMAPSITKEHIDAILELNINILRHITLNDL